MQLLADTGCGQTELSLDGRRLLWVRDLDRALDAAGQDDWAKVVIRRAPSFLSLRDCPDRPGQSHLTRTLLGRSSNLIPLASEPLIQIFQRSLRDPKEGMELS